MIFLTLGLVDTMFSILNTLCCCCSGTQSWTAACQASPSFTISWSLFKLMSTEWTFFFKLLPLAHVIGYIPERRHG